MRFQPSTLSSVQRQIFLDSILCLGLTHRWTQQRSTNGGNCCSQATRIANATRVQQISSSSPIASRQQQRFFAVSRNSKEESSSTDPPTTQYKGKEKQKGDKKANLPTSNSESSTKDNGNSEVHQTTISNGSKADHNTHGSTIAEKDGFISQSKGKASTVKSSSQRAKRRVRPFNIMLKFKNPPLRYIPGGDEAYPLEERVSMMKSAVDEFYATYIRVRKKGSSIPSYIQIGNLLSEYGTQCRRIRKDKENHDLILRKIGQHLEEMVKFVEDGLEKKKDIALDTRYSVECLRIQSLSFQDNLEEARRRFEIILRDNKWLEELEEIEKASLTSTMHRDSRFKLDSLVNVLGSVLQITLNRLTGLDERVYQVDSLVKETMDWLLKHPGLFHFNSQHHAKHMFRFDLLTSMLTDPLQYVQSRVEGLDKEAATLFTSSVCRSLSRNLAILPTYKIYRWAMGSKVVLQESIIRQLIRLATLENEAQIAARMVSTHLSRARNGIRVLELSTCRTMAFSCARRQDEKKMEELLRIIDNQYDQEISEKIQFAFEARLLCYSGMADVSRTIQLVEQRYDMRIAPGQEPEEGLLYPDYEVHARIVQTYTRANERDEAESMLHRMVRFGQRPNASLLTYVLEYYAKIDDLPSTLALYRQLRNSALDIGVRTGTSLIALFAKRKDSISAFEVLQTMQNDGLIPDRTTWNALLNAYVEADEWQAAMDLFTWMQQNHDYKLRPSSHTYNIILKAHVLRAIPVQEIFSFFKQIMAAGIDPDPYTFSLVLQSVADAGLLDLAEQVFSSIEDRLGDMQGRPAGKGAGIWHFTIMIQAYLRANKVKIAREYANELQERGQTATGVLWGVLVKAYAAREEDESLQASQSLVQSALFKNPKEYVAAYQPLIGIHSKRAGVEQVVMLLEELTENEADIPIRLWTALMDGFRRQGNITGTLEIWNLIFDKAVETVNFTSYIDSNKTPELVKSGKNAQSNLLCLPLSILIDTLARHGENERIAKEWLKCRRAGFAFDSHNWNHLCAAFIKAGRLIDSLNIITRVLSNEAPSLKWRELEIDSLSKSFQKMNSTLNVDESVKTNSPSRPPNRRHQNRVRDDLEAYYPLEEEDLKRRMRRESTEASPSSDFYPNEDEEVLGKSQFNSKDEAEPSMLRFLQKQTKRDEILSPYYPHFETMKALEELLENIKKSGGAVNVEDRLVSLEEIMSGYPRVEVLLANYREKVDLLQEFARNDALQDSGLSR